MKKYLFATKTIAVSALSVGLLAGCQKPAPQNPIADTVKKFEEGRERASVQYGVRTVNHRDQNLTSVDCVVFNQAAQSPMPIDDVGAMTAYVDAMQLRIQSGCASLEQALPQYETSRRALISSWENTINQSPYNIQNMLRNSNMGRLIDSQIKNVSSEEKSCWGQVGRAKREKGSASNIGTLTRTCAQKASWGRTEHQCTNAWNIITSHQYAQGNRDDWSYLSELVARYRWMYNSCSPSAAQEYVQFHSTVPQHLFQGPAYRFTISIDPVLRCQIQGVNDKKSRRVSYKAHTEYTQCAQKLGLRGLYTGDMLPNLITAKELNDTNAWLFNPLRSAENPQLWSFNDCEKNMISQLQTQGVNQVPPQILKNYCLRLQRKQ